LKLTKWKKQKKGLERFKKIGKLGLINWTTYYQQLKTEKNESNLLFDFTIDKTNTT
jgi:hypothetical protein